MSLYKIAIESGNNIILLLSKKNKFMEPEFIGSLEAF